MAAVAVANPYAPYFVEYSNKYKCCCKCCHVKTGTLVIGIITAVGIAISLIQSGLTIARISEADDVYTDTDLSAVSTLYIISMVVMAIEAVAVICLFIGWALENRYLLVPFLIVQVLVIIYVLIMMIFVIVVIVVGGEFAENAMTAVSGGSVEHSNRVRTQLDDATVVTGVIIIILYLLVLVIFIWLFTVVLGCYRFFRDKEEFYNNGGSSSQQVQYSAPPPMGFQQQPQAQVYPAAVPPEPEKYEY